MYAHDSHDVDVWHIFVNRRIAAKLFQADNFLVGDVNQLQPLAFMEAAQKAKVPVTFRPGVETQQLEKKWCRSFFK